jgi:hypothetical protein
MDEERRSSLMRESKFPRFVEEFVIGEVRF